MSKVIVRPATPQDLPRLIDLGRLMHVESNFSEMNFNASTAQDYLLQLMAHDFVGIAEAEGTILGGMAGKIHKTWFGDDLVATDVALFIDPKYRGGKAVIMLIKFFVAWAKAFGAKQIRPGVSTGHLGAVKLYEHMGFSVTGSNFLMNV